MYVEADLAAYALSVAEDIDFSEEPLTSFEAISCVKFVRWIIAMQEEMEPLHKNGI